VPLRREYRHAKKRIYLEPPSNGSKTVRTRITRILPALPPPPPPPPPEPAVIEVLPPPLLLPEPEPEHVDVIAVDIEPSTKSSESSSKSSKSRSRSRSRGSRERDRNHEVYVERERVVPAWPEYETYRYVEGPRMLALPPPPSRREVRDERDTERMRITIEDRRRQREYFYP